LKGSGARPYALGYLFTVTKSWNQSSTFTIVYPV
jgi:hypothetical protein